MKIDDFQCSWTSPTSGNMPEMQKNIFHEYFFMENKNATHIVSDIAQGMGVLWDR